MMAPDEVRRKYCANCGKEIKPGQGVALNNRIIVCSEECKREFSEGRSE